MRIACVNYEPVSWYYRQGWSRERLALYYNPNHVADEVCIFASGDRDWSLSPTVLVRGYRRLSSLRGLVRKFRPDVIRCYEAFDSFALETLDIAAELGIPSYLSLHDCRVPYVPELVGYTAVTAYSETLVERAARELGREVELQRNGIDSRLFAPGPAGDVDARLASARHRLFTISRPDPVKNLDSILAASEVVARRLGSVGHAIGGPGTADIDDGVRLGLGVIAESTIVGYHNWSSVFVQPQRSADLGMAATEALMVGRPVVVTAGDGNTRLLIDGSRGALVPMEDVNDPERVADAICSVLERTWDREGIRRWGQRLFDTASLRAREAERYLRLAGAIE